MSICQQLTDSLLAVTWEFTFPHKLRSFLRVRENFERVLCSIKRLDSSTLVDWYYQSQSRLKSNQINLAGIYNGIMSRT